MEITYDPAKDVANQAKHGVSLALAAKLRKANPREVGRYVSEI
jgi:uncharacterized DUF497 family protein